MFVNKSQRFEVLSPDAMAVIDKGWRRLVSEMGVEFMSDRALDLFRAAGQKVEGNLVKFDPEFILEQVKKAPSEFDVQARNPKNNVHIGGDSMVFVGNYGSPFVRDLDTRRTATFDDFQNFVKLAQAFPLMDSAGHTICEPDDLHLDTRHIDMTYALATLTDKFFQGNVISGDNAADVIKMTEIIFGGREAIEKTPATVSLINCNSPLRWDDRMLDAQFEYSAANQAVILTPFIMMGAMSPVTIPSALVQQIAEAFTGIALSQLIRPGAPTIFGSFMSNVDMQSGSPQFGTPESFMGQLCTGQIARHYNLPFRSGGGLNASQTVDAQAGYEALMTMFATFLSGTNYVLHTAGWLEGGLVASFEKFVMDNEILGQLQHAFTPLEVNEKTLAFESHEEAGHGGHFLGTMHTLENFRTAFYRPFLSSSDNFDRWTRNGSKTTDVRANEIAHKMIDEFEAPAMDDAIKAELDEFVAKRKKELIG